VPGVPYCSVPAVDPPRRTRERERQEGRGSGKAQAAHSPRQQQQGTRRQPPRDIQSSAGGRSQKKAKQEASRGTQGATLGRAFLLTDKGTPCRGRGSSPKAHQELPSSRICAPLALLPLFPRRHLCQGHTTGLHRTTGDREHRTAAESSLAHLHCPATGPGPMQ